MNFQFFLDRLAMPLLIGAGVFLLSQFISNFATTEDLYKHKIENTEQISKIEVKLDHIIKTNEEIKDTLGLIARRIR